MKLFNLATAALIVQSLSGNAFAQNRGDLDTIFNEPAKAGWTQVFLGITELIASNYAYPGLTSHQNAVNAAQLNLDISNDLPLSEAQRKATITAIINNPNNYKFESQVGKAEELKPHHAQRLEKIKSASLVSKAEKEAVIWRAEINLAKSREAALKAAQSLGFVDKAVKVVRVGASVLLVGDVVARIYVWNAKDANPGISPAAIYIQHMLTK